MNIVPSYNKSGYKILEDTYYSGESFESETNKSVFPEITVSCKNKNAVITAPLSTKIKISGHAEWEELFGGGISSLGGSAIESFNNIFQMTSGKSIQQPWMNRKTYKSTKPLSLSFTMNFVAEENPEKEVFIPCMKLLSFIFPRQTTDSKEVQKWLSDHHLAGTIPQSLAETIASTWVVPGPTISYYEHSKDKNGVELETDEDKLGDCVTLQIGQMFVFGGVYLEDVDLEFSQACNKEGYPLFCSANLKATLMDANYTDSDGNFSISQFKDNQSAVSDMVNQLSGFISDSATAISNIVTEFIGYFRSDKK